MSVLVDAAEPTVSSAVFSPHEVAACARRIRERAHVVAHPDGRRLGVLTGSWPAGEEVVGSLPPLYPEWLGGRVFCEAHGVRFPYVAGEMVGGIATTGMVVAMARARMLGFFGTGGLGPARVERAVDELVAALPGLRNWGVNLLHAPAEPRAEYELAKLLLHKGVQRISASAFTELTPAVVLCSAAGLRHGPDGQVVRRTHVFAKVSRPEVAAGFLSPPPPEVLRALVERGDVTPAEADLAARVPVAEDVTVEADSGGHTDNRPLSAILPSILTLRDDLVRHFGYTRGVRVGAAGGLGTPGAVAAAFALGADYVLTGSVNQACVEAGTSEEVKAMLAAADLADVAMAPAADMFEAGVRVQVLRRGTMFAPRAERLFAAYQSYGSLEEIPPGVRAGIERDVLRAPVEQVWEWTRAYWQERDPSEIDRAEADPRHRMALVFRWYLGNTSRWAITGQSDRRADYQIHCGPVMGAFNRWTAGGFLADPANRSVVQVALNLLEGAAVLTRAHQFRTYGLPVPATAFAFTPTPLA